MNKELVTAALFQIVKVVLLFQKIRYVLLILGGREGLQQRMGSLCHVKCNEVALQKYFVVSVVILIERGLPKHNLSLPEGQALPVFTN